MQQNKDNNSLILAADRGHTNIVKVLLNNGANVNAQNEVSD